jgi:hypothetical protein
MALTGFPGIRVGAILFLLAGQVAAQKPAEVTAVLTRIEGQVTLTSETRAEFRSIRRAAQRQVLRRGEIVHIPAGAQMTVVCSTETLVSLTGPRDWALDAGACGQGVLLPESSYRNLTSYAGRVLPRKGALLLEIETRNVEAGPGPNLLSPRDTAVMDSHPRLIWTQVPDAVEYEIELRGAVESSIRLAAADLHCGRGSGLWRDLDVCSWTPSSKWPALEPEKPVFLKLGFLQASAAPLRQARDVHEIRLLSASDQHSVQEDLRRIDTLPMDPTSHLLLSAGAYAKAGLYSDAVVAYDEALQTQEIPEVRVTLGDLYLISGLATLADQEYRHVMAAAASGSAAQAAAEFGLGQVDYCRKRFDDARAHFERARSLYVTLELPEEAEAARAAGEGTIR